MTGVAAVAFAATLTSCSKAGDLYDEGRVEKEKEQAIVNSYEKAFEAAFGKVGANVDWGFSSKKSSARALTRAVGDYSAYKGSLTPVNVQFPQDADASNFDPDLTNIPSYNDYCKTLGNANWTPDEFACGEVYIDKVQKIHIWGENGKRAKLYIKAGTYDFSNETFDLCADADLYLLNGATVTLNNTAANTAKFDVYIASGAKLIANGENGYRADVDAHVYNHGTIECTRFEVNGTSFLYNVGTLNVPEGDVYIANSTSRIVNDNTINAASTHVEGSGALQNNAEWTVTGNTVVNCTDGGWVNNGKWATLNYHYTAGSSNVINNCFLKVTNEFNINMSSATSDKGFKIDSGGGVETVYFNGGKCAQEVNPGATKDEFSGPYKVIMGQKSVFKVTGTATLDGGNKGWGFFGPSSGDYAVFQAKNVVRVPGLENNQGAVTYGGNLYVSAETHFAQGNDGQADHYFIYEEGGFDVNTNIYAAGFKAGKPNVTIQETPCNPGFDGSDPLFRVIAEDLTASQSGDFDFNDVVFDVVKYENGKTTLRLQACGGTLPLKIGSDEEGNGGVEVHSLYGDNTPDATTGKYKMWNTGQNSHAPVDFEIDNKYTTPEELLGLNIVVFKENKWMLLTAQKGVAACKILVDDRFPIVPERHSIADENGNFTTYVQGNWKGEDGFWWIQK